MLDVSKWPLFSLLSSEFISQVRMICVFGSSGNESLLITKENHVYALGSNCSGCLGTGDVQSSLEPRKVSTLCQKNILSIDYGSRAHVLADITKCCYGYR
ncbi:unnamed protein product [Owenia fusiformis]|uniref:Uncharacterized protein n=1 Tax=Owenia fusiformis TaxID=6347 RepID=A0A8S4QA94_OWEFU|nr:unnamed protein product [Owenia fusiformis]